MINLKKVCVVTSLVIALAFTGCASKGVESTSSQVTKESKISINQGAKNMRDALKAMNEKLTAKDDEGAVKISAKLEENWSKIEDDLKGKDKELYEKVEVPLTTINGGVQVKPLDVQTITTAMNELDQQLVEIEKLK